jgi:hypothetical protein
LQAVGQVGLASLGAAAVVGEAVINSTAAVAQSGAAATADIVEHRYGPAAGQVARDTTAVAGNVLRSVQHATLLFSSGTGIAKAVVKNSAKEHVKEQKQQQRQKINDETEFTSVDAICEASSVRSKSSGPVTGTAPGEPIRQAPTPSNVSPWSVLDVESTNVMSDGELFLSTRSQCR